MNTADTPRFLTVEQVAVATQLSERTVRRLLEQGEIPYARIGNNLRIPARWMEAVHETATRVRASGGEQTADQTGKGLGAA